MAGTERYVRNSTADFLVFTKDSETDQFSDQDDFFGNGTQQNSNNSGDGGADSSASDSDNCLMLTAVLLPNICGIFLRKMNYPKVQLVQNLHKLQIMARPITTNSTPCPPLLLLATAPIPPVPHNSVNGQPKCWIHLPGRDMFWIRIGLLMGKSLMKITSTIWFPKYRKSAPASAAFTRKLRIFMLLP